MLPKQYADALTGRLAPEWFRPVPGRLWWLPLHGLIATACTLLIVDGRVGVPAKFGLSIIIGFSFCGLGILAHEILHGSVVESFWWRRCLGAICLAPLGIGPVFWTVWHNIHHANTQHPVKDPDTWGTKDSIPQDRAMGFRGVSPTHEACCFLFFWPLA